MQNVSSLELVDVIHGGNEKSNIQEMIKTPRMRNSMAPNKVGYHGDGGSREALSEIKQMIKTWNQL